MRALPPWLHRPVRRHLLSCLRRVVRVRHAAARCAAPQTTSHATAAAEPRATTTPPTAAAADATATTLNAAAYVGNKLRVGSAKKALSQSGKAQGRPQALTAAGHTRAPWDACPGHGCPASNM